MKERGLVPPVPLVADGRLHRCDTGDGGHLDGAYLLHIDARPIGGLINWKDGRGWETFKVGEGRELTAAERRIMERERSARRIEAFKLAARATRKAESMWAFAKPASPDHKYLVDKMAKPYGIRELNDWLLIPARDVAGRWHSLQRIYLDGTKKFISGGKVQGCYYSIGKSDGPVCVAEGYATAASIHEATGYTTVVAFDAGNLLPVACSLRIAHKDIKLVLCADDDPVQKSGAPGVGVPKAIEAAKAAGGLVAIPDFGVDKPDGMTDFNDLFRLSGPWAVRQCVENAK
jgi:putative DNA primase/helicase